MSGLIVHELALPRDVPQYATAMHVRCFKKICDFPTVYFGSRILCLQ